MRLLSNPQADAQTNRFSDPHFWGAVDYTLAGPNTGADTGHVGPHDRDADSDRRADAAAFVGAHA